MKSIALKFNVTGILVVSDKTKDAIASEFAIIDQRRLQEIWKPFLPLREKVSIEVQGCCLMKSLNTVFGTIFVVIFLLSELR